jgi:hypothetical protein
MSEHRQHIGNGVFIACIEGGFTVYKQDEFKFSLKEDDVNELLGFILGHGDLILPVQCPVCEARAELVEHLKELLQPGADKAKRKAAAVIKKASKPQGVNPDE